MSKKPKLSTNSIATPFVEEAYKLYCRIFHHFYSYPFEINLKNHQASVEVDDMFQPKYIPWLVSIIVVTTLIGFGSCLFVLLFSFFHRESVISVPVIVFCIMLTSCSALEWTTYLIYCRATEMKFALNQLFKLEREFYNATSKKSRDVEGLFLIIINTALSFLNFFFPLFLIMTNLDPFHYIFEIYLPFPHERSTILSIAVLLIRLFLSFACVFEFNRFLTLLLFIYVFFTFTMMTCLKQLKNGIHIFGTKAITLYSQLRIVMRTSDFFMRNSVAVLVSCSQFIIITMCWTVLKCWHILPPIMTFCVTLTALFAPIGLLILLPQAVNICTTSSKFIKDMKKSYHTVNRSNKNRLCYLQWCSQTMFVIRFGEQLSLNQNTMKDYFEVLVTNLTNSILLVHP